VCFTVFYARGSLNPLGPEYVVKLKTGSRPRNKRKILILRIIVVIIIITLNRVHRVGFSSTPVLLLAFLLPILYSYTNGTTKL